MSKNDRREEIKSFHILCLHLAHLYAYPLASSGKGKQWKRQRTRKKKCEKNKKKKREIYRKDIHFIFLCQPAANSFHNFYISLFFLKKTAIASGDTIFVIFVYLFYANEHIIFHFEFFFFSFFHTLMVNLKMIYEEYEDKRKSERTFQEKAQKERTEIIFILLICCQLGINRRREEKKNLRIGCKWNLLFYLFIFIFFALIPPGFLDFW